MKIKISSGENIIPLSIINSRNSIAILDSINNKIIEYVFNKKWIAKTESGKHRCPNCGATKRIIDNCGYCGT